MAKAPCRLLFYPICTSYVDNPYPLFPPDVNERLHGKKYPHADGGGKGEAKGSKAKASNQQEICYQGRKHAREGGEGCTETKAKERWH